ncbi:uncharacterized protein LOC129799288 [Phlebotomus papatasi]|uniref:uncharacterized protein LOC129799288 n=1 Tax=Phlebotomus papatasi TaxID=29031 RepID=UPI0024846467|nr:uncharacterized protein LOC129799288 [Phlebotomus papatasi]
MAAASSGERGESNRQFSELSKLPSDDASFPVLSRGKRKRATITMDLNKLFTNSHEAKRFIIAESLEKTDFLSISCFKVKRTLDTVCGKIPHFQPLSNGSLLIQVNSIEQGRKMTEINEIDGKKVRFSWHPFLNQSKGVISCFAFTKFADEELKKELAAFNITEVKRIKRKIVEDGKLVLKDTGSFIVTFNQPELPKTINAYYHALNIKPYIPNPMRCQKCQRYGHHDSKCRGKEAICGSCSQIKHDGECTHPVKCTSCGEGHVSWYRKCRVFQEEFEIQRIRVMTKVSYIAAKKEFKEKKRMYSSFANVVSSNSRVSPDNSGNRKPPAQYPRKLIQGEHMENESIGNLNNKATGIAFKSRSSEGPYVTDTAEAERSSPFIFHGKTNTQPETTEKRTEHHSAPIPSDSGSGDGVPQKGAGIEETMRETANLLASANKVLYNSDSDMDDPDTR